MARINKNLIQNNIDSRSPKKHIARVVLVSMFILLLFFAITMRFHVNGDLEGIYVLRSDTAPLYDIQDDLFFGEKDRLLFKLEFEPLYDFFSSIKYRGVADPHLHYEWNNRNGNGFVITHFPNGRRLLTCFGRFLDDNKRIPEGLFVGGGLPYARNEEGEVTMNETGMAFYTGTEWHHLWCNVNEGIVSRSLHVSYPSEWKFLGSRVLEASTQKVVIKSSHEVNMDGVPLRIDRYAFFKAEDTFFVLAIVIRNNTMFKAQYLYVYGDEPWVGDYGSSLGNVGWVQDRVYYYEGLVDPEKYAFAGLWDIGNPKVPYEREMGAEFTGMANFIEWLGDNKPDLVYFGNSANDIVEESKKVPLSSEASRVIFLRWGPKTIKPNEEQVILLGIGMAGFGPQKTLPSKPAVRLSSTDLEYLRQ
jgi:hypothetical protein